MIKKISAVLFLVLGLIGAGIERLADNSDKGGVPMLIDVAEVQLFTPTEKENYKNNLVLLPQFTKYEGNPIIVGREDTLGQAGYPSPIKMDGIIDNPIDKYYLYWAGHDGGGINLSTAPHPLGPWTDRGVLFTAADMGGGHHVSSPDVVFFPELSELRMYYHRAYTRTTDNKWVQETEYAVTPLSGDGTVWTKQGTVISAPYDGRFDEKETSYARIKKMPNGKYVIVYQGRDSEGNAPGFGIIVSDNGVDGQRSLNPLFYQSQYGDAYNPTTFNGGTPYVFTYKGVPWLLYADRTVTPCVMRATPLIELYTLEPKITTLLELSQGWETPGGSLEGGAILKDDNMMYLYYHHTTLGQSPNTKSIGVAYAEIKPTLYEGKFVQNDEGAIRNADIYINKSGSIIPQGVIVNY